MSSFNCNRCNAPNASNAKFCTNCGASLTQSQNSPYQSPNSEQGGAMISEFAFAGFWKRFVAYIVDVILYLIVFAIVVSLLGGSLFTTATSPEAILAAAGVYLFYYPGWWLYFALMESSSAQATLGKKIMGIKVTDRFGQPLSFGHATGRHFSALITQFTLTIGYLMAAFTARKQALHDMIASTLVVNNRYEASQIRTASENPGSGMSAIGIVAIVFFVLLIPVGGILAAIAIPAYHDYTVRSQVAATIHKVTPIQTTISDYASNTGYWPNNLEQAGIQPQQSSTQDYQILLAAEGAYIIVFKKPETLAQNRLRFDPELMSDGSYRWQCSSDDIKRTHLPSACRQD